MRVGRTVLILAALTATAIVGMVSRDARATQSPVEMNFACALKSNGLMRYVSNLNQCKGTEIKVTIHPGPITVCVNPDGTVRKIPPYQCQKPGVVLTLPPASGTVYFCAANTNGQLRYVTPGSGYSVSETVPSGWDLTSSTCDNGNSPSNITVNAGQTVTCTFTDRKRGTIIVKKVTNPSPDPSNTSFSFTAGGGLTPTSFSLKNGDQQTFSNVAPGSGYNVTESVPLGWELTSSTCDDGSSFTNITVSAGETVTCTFTDRKNSAPVADDQTVSDVQEDTPKTITLHASDADDDPLTFSIVSGQGPTHGSLGSISSPDCSAVNTCTATVDYTPDLNYNGPDSFKFKVNDGSLDSNEATVSITVNAVNDAPVLANIEGSALSYTENDAPTAITSTLTVSDVDNANLASATVAISAGYQSGADVLAFTNQNGITGSWNAGTGTLTLTGTASLADYQTALRSVPYANPSDAPSATTRTVSFQVEDGQAQNHASNTQTRDITVTPSNDSPNGVNDTFNGANSALAGVTLAVSTSPSEPHTSISGNLLTNDTDPDTPHANLTASAGASSTNGGAVSVNSDGTFSYTPPPGFTGSDTFTYTVHDNDAGGDKTDTATVTINVVGPRVWFVNPGGSAGNGTSPSPFASLAPLSTGGASDSLDGTGDVIFVYKGTGNAASNGFVLEGNQRLVGQPQGLSVTDSLSRTFNLVAAGSTNPTVTNGSGAGLTLASGNTIQRIDVSGASGAGVTGTGITTLTYESNTSISGNSGGGVVLSGAASGNIDVAAAISTSAGDSVSVAGRSGGTTNFTGAISGTGTGISLSGNTNATINFTGGLTLNSAANFSATGGGTVNVTGSSNTIGGTTPGAGPAVNVASTTIGGNGLNFQKISATGGANGIVLNNTGASGSLTVAGGGNTSQGGDSSGGTIQNTTTGAGISLTSTLAPSFNNMNIHNTFRSGIDGTSTNGFTFTYGTIDKSGLDNSLNPVDTGVASADVSNIAFNDVSSGVNNLSGAVSIPNSNLTNAWYHGIDIYNESGTISNLTISNDTLTSSSNTSQSKGSGIRVQANGSASSAGAVTKADVSNDSVSNFPSASGILIQGGNAALGPQAVLGTPGSGTNIISITGNAISGASSAAPMGSNGIQTAMTGTGQAKFSITNNGTAGTPIRHFLGVGITSSGGNLANVVSIISGNFVDAGDNIFGSNGMAVGSQLGIGQTGSISASITNKTLTPPDGHELFAGVTNSNNSANLIIKN